MRKAIGKIAASGRCLSEQDGTRVRGKEMAMWRSRCLKFACIGIISIMASTSAQASGIGEGNGEVGFDIGVTWLDDYLTDEVATRGTIRGGYFFSDLLQLEGQASMSFVSTDNRDYWHTTVFANAVVNFQASDTIVPYFIGGLGVAFAEVSNGFDRDDSSVVWQIGGGSRFYLGNKLALRAELTYMQDETFDDSWGHTNLVVGLAWRLGAGK